MTTPLPARSVFVPAVTVLVDPWSVNPLLDDAKQTVAATVAAATVTNGEPPTMFDSGDLPPFIASGVDPRFLANLPWRIRHAAAMETSSLTVLKWVEEFGHDDTVDMPVAGQWQYINRFRDWLAGWWTNPSFKGVDASAQAAADADLYDALFAADEAARAAKLAPINAKAADMHDQRNRVGKYALNQPGRAQR